MIKKQDSTCKTNHDKATELLVYLVKKGVQLYNEDDRLCYQSAKGLITAEDIKALKTYKANIIAILNHCRVLKLSSIQARLWFLSELDTTSLGYQFCFSLVIKGDLNEYLFLESFQRVIDNHPALRARFANINGETLQFIQPPHPASNTVKSVQHKFNSKQHSELMRQDLIKPFQLDRESLLRSVLYKHGENNYLWGLCLHHIIADGWTFRLIVNELSYRYQNRLHIGTEQVNIPSSPTRETENNYARYIESERCQEENPDHPDFIKREENLHYWIKQLKNGPPLDFMCDFKRPEIRTYNARRVFFTMPPAVVTPLKNIAQGNNTTLNCVCLTLLNALLYHYTQQPDLAIGTPHANRFNQHIETIAGCFISTLIMRNKINPEGDFIQALEQVSQTAIDAYEHQDYSFEKLTSALVKKRDLSRNPLFQILFVFQNDLSDLLLPNTRSHWHPFDPQIGQFEFELHLRIVENSLEGTLIYNTDLYSQSSAERFAEHFQSLAKRLHSRQQLPIQDNTPLSKKQRDKIVLQWNRKPHIPKPGTTPQITNVADAFMQQAQRRPLNIAIEDEHQILSYHALSKRIDVIARLIGPADEEVIGIMMTRSTDMVAALLAILKSGAVFVPLDPEFPINRIAYMIENSGLERIVSHRSCQTSSIVRNIKIANKNGAPSTPTLLFVDETIHLTSLRPTFRPREEKPLSHKALIDKNRNETATNKSAYIIYTSGSTGIPKGVLVSHHNLLNILHSMSKIPGVSVQDNWLAVTTLSFDISILELLLPLLNGAKLIVASQKTANDGKQLASLITDSKATLMQATPATWKMLIDSGWQGSPHLTILSGGETLQKDLAEKLLDNRCRELWNVYGPTETTIWSLISKINKNDLISLGKPIDNTRCYVLNNQNQPVAIGMPGELLIAGDGCSLGYWRKEQANQQRFINLKPLLGFDERAYRTGDIVKYDADGNLIYLGRKDQQLKVRGYRIEPEEIETTLREIATIKDAAVILQDDSLVAYLSIKPSLKLSMRDRHANQLSENKDKKSHSALTQSSLTQDEQSQNSLTQKSQTYETITQYLRQTLPHYMIPNRFYLLNNLPMTLNGKIDRKILLTEGEYFDRLPLFKNNKNRHEEPENELEIYVATLYKKILNVNYIGRNGDFFDLGGHSLLAARLRNDITKTHAINIDLQVLMRNSSVKDLALIINNEKDSAKNEDRLIEEFLDELESMTDEQAVGLLS